MSKTALTTPVNVSALARQYGVSRTTIRRWRAKGWTPPTTATIEIVEPSQLASIPSTLHGRSLSALLIVVAAAIAGLALVINAQFGHGLGTTPLAAVTFAAMAVVGDLLAVMLPTAAGRLWHACHRGLAVAAWFVWSAAAALAILASLGFVEQNVSDTAAGRRVLVATAAASTNQRTANIEAAKITAEAARKAREGECGKRGPLCRDREADERAANSALASAIAAPIQAAPAVGADDPQVRAVVRLAKWAGLPITADDVGNARLVLMIAIPNLAGLVLAFGIALRRRAVA